MGWGHQGHKVVQPVPSKSAKCKEHDQLSYIDERGTGKVTKFTDWQT